MPSLPEENSMTKENKTMLDKIKKGRIPVLFGFVIGLFFGAWLIGQIPRSPINLFLQKPFNLVFDNFHIFPSDSLGGLAIEIPLWFVYWGCLGALVCFLLQLLYYTFRRLSHRGDN
jgi:hypothetical protein